MHRKGKPYALLVGLQIHAAAVENSMEIPPETKELKTYLLYDSAILFWVLIQRMQHHIL